MKTVKIKQIILFFCWLCASLALFTSCTNREKRGWIKTKEGYYVYGHLAKDESSIYSWDGETRGTVIHGKGKLTVYSDNGNYKNTAKINAFYGTINNKDWLETPEGKFIGNVEGNQANGFGVLVHDDNVEIGEFKNGKLDGQAVLYVNNELRYRGEMQDGLYDGQGMELKDGNVRIGKWDDGILTESNTSLATEEVKRLWNRVTFQNEKNQNTNSKEEATDYIQEMKFGQGKEIFCDSLATQLSNFIQTGVSKTLEDRTDWLSIQPFRMFWESIFTSRSKRIEGWMQALADHGLSYVDLEEIINAQIREYNKNNPSDKLNKVKLAPFSENQIIDDATFKNINDREVSGWGDNLWFELALATIIVIILGILTMGAALPLWPISQGIACVVACIFFVISLFNGSIEQDITNGLLQNYINYFESQDIMNQILR